MINNSIATAYARQIWFLLLVSFQIERLKFLISTKFLHRDCRVNTTSGAVQHATLALHDFSVVPLEKSMFSNI